MEEDKTQAPQYCIRGGGFLRPGEAQPPLPSPTLDESDYGEDAPAKPVLDKDAMVRTKAAINGLYRTAVALEAEITSDDEALKAKKERLRALKEREIPSTVRECWSGDFTCEDDTIIVIKDKLEQSILAANRSRAYQWLEDHGHADVVKREVNVSFIVGEGEKAEALAKELMAKYNRTVGVDKKVEPATLKSLLAKRLADGKEVPMELFGVRQFVTAEFKKPK